MIDSERKKSHDKVYPKGYVEMLEQQQSQLVNGLQEMYKRLLNADAWEGDTLSEANGHPLTHDILSALGLLESKQDGSGEMEMFEEDCEKLQSRLISEGAGFTQRRGSFSSDSDHSQNGHGRSGSHGTPVLTKSAVYKDNFNFSAPPSPPASQGSPLPAPRQRPSFPQSHASPLQQSSPLTNDPQFYQPEWAYADPSNAELLMRSNFAVQSPDLDQGLGNMGDMTGFNQWDTTAYDMKYDPMGMATSMTSYPQQLHNAFSGMKRMQDTGMTGLGMDPNMMDVEFNQFIQVTS